MPQYRARRSSLRRRLRDRVTDAIAATLCQLMRLSGARFDDDRFNESYRPTTAVRRRPGVRPPGRRQFRARRENKI